MCKHKAWVTSALIGPDILYILWLLCLLVIIVNHITVQGGCVISSQFQQISLITGYVLVKCLLLGTVHYNWSDFLAAAGISSNYWSHPYLIVWKEKRRKWWPVTFEQGEDGSHMGSQRLKDIECELGEQKKSTAKITKLCLAAIKVTTRVENTMTKMMMIIPGLGVTGEPLARACGKERWHQLTGRGQL